MSKPNGGMAFPMTAGPKDAYGNLSHAEQWGMSLRDYFAGQALIGLITHYGTHNGARMNELAVRSYLIADTMIAERGE